jgi:hypothetical protein
MGLGILSSKKAILESCSNADPNSPVQAAISMALEHVLEPGSLMFHRPNVQRVKPVERYRKA